MTINTKDGNHAVSFIECGESILACAELRDGQNYGGNSYWFTVGTFKTMKGAIRSAKRQMAKFNLELCEA